MMPVIKIVIATLALTLALTPLSHKAQAYDESWLIAQTIYHLDNKDQISFDYVRRDFGSLYSDQFLDLYRLSYGWRVENWVLMAGGAYLDFGNGQSERRLHQFAVGQYRPFFFLGGFVRLGFEQRHFNQDSDLYLRFRLRLQGALMPNWSLSPAFYNEVFWVPRGGDRFVDGGNENRLGMGLRYASSSWELFAFHTFAYLETPRSTSYPQWLQLQVLFKF